MSIGPFGPTTPSPEGSTSFSTPIQQPSATSPGDAQAGFIALAVGKIKQMIGTRYYLVDDATLTGIATKLWQSVALQQLYAGYQQSPSLYAATLEAQIQAAILNPAQDPSIDPTITTDYITAKQGAGESLSTAELTALANSTQAANAPVPRPFDTSQVSGYDFNTPLPADLAASTGQKTNMGTDYGTPAGSRIVSPFAGTVHIKHDPFRGNQVTVTLDNGWVLSFGHVAQGTAQDGARVNPGDLVAISGQNVGDAKGAVTLVEWFDPQGNRHDPHQVMDPIFNGTTYSQIKMPGAAGTGSPTVNAVLDREYPTIKSDWLAMFGSPPSPEDVYNVLQHGVSPTEWTDYIRGLPGHIPGMSVGSIYDLRTLADSESMKSLGHASTDGIVKELNDQGMTSQGAIKLWYDEHSPNEIDKTVYNQIVNVLKPNMDGALNEHGVDPRMVKSIHDGAIGHPGPQQV